MAETKEAKGFRRAFRGYNREDVAAFVEEFNTSYMQMENYYRGLLSKKAEEQERDRTEIELLKKRAVQAALEKEKAEKSASEAKDALALATEELEVLRAAAAKKIEESSEAAAEREELRAASAEAKKELSRAQESLERLTKCCTEKETLRQEAVEELRQSKEKESELGERIFASEKEKEALRGEYVTLQESFDSMVEAAKQSLDEAQSLIAAQNAKIEALEKELREAKLAEKTGAESAEDLLEKAKKQAEEIVRKAKNTAQLIQISALKRKDPPQTSPERATASPPSSGSPEDLSRSLRRMYGEG